MQSHWHCVPTMTRLCCSGYGDHGWTGNSAIRPDMPAAPSRHCLHAAGHMLEPCCVRAKASLCCRLRCCPAVCCWRVLNQASPPVARARACWGLQAVLRARPQMTHPAAGSGCTGSLTSGPRYPQRTAMGLATLLLHPSQQQAQDLPQPRIGRVHRAHRAGQRLAQHARCP